MSNNQSVHGWWTALSQKQHKSEVAFHCERSWWMLFFFKHPTTTQYMNTMLGLVVVSLCCCVVVLLCCCVSVVVSLCCCNVLFTKMYQNGMWEQWETCFDHTHNEYHYIVTIQPSDPYQPKGLLLPSPPWSCTKLDNNATINCNRNAWIPALVQQVLQWHQQHHNHCPTTTLLPNLICF